MPDAPLVSPGTSALRSLSDVVHQRSRLSVLATLYEAGCCDFSFLSKVTGLTEGNLSRHLQVLADSGLVCITKEFVGKRPRTRLKLTSQGTVAFEHELTVLRGLVDATQPAPATGRRAGNRGQRRRPTPAAQPAVPSLKPG